MADSTGRTPILAAGGIVLRGNTRPRIAIVRLRRDKTWVLPKGKLMRREHPRDAAKREVLEETGHEVSVHQFLGSMAYAADGEIKIVQFWMMRASGSPTHDLANDVKDVRWLPLHQAIATLSRPHEKVFLTHVGPIALDLARKSMGGKRLAKAGSRRNGTKRRHAAPVAPHVIALDSGKARPSAFVKVLGGWIGRARRSWARG
jgi:8-oxo-dGTP diphosphatase